MTRRTAGSAAAALALASAAVSAYWTLGGTALLDTVGGGIEDLARERSAGAIALGAAVVAAKLAAAALALALRDGRAGDRLRRPALAGGVALAFYGALLTLAGALALGGVVTGPDDDHALRWHVLLWDPWFAVWGAALALAARRPV